MEDKYFFTKGKNSHNLALKDALKYTKMLW